jgi:dopamine beta-monooxygenase
MRIRQWKKVWIYIAMSIIEYICKILKLFQDIVDTTGIRLYVQKEERPIEFGILTTGSTSDAMALWIPPKSKNLRIDNICRSRLMEEMYKETGNITIFAQLPHTHLAGHKFFSKVLRDNKEIEMISNNPYYDSNFQYVTFLQKNVVLKKGDQILTTCHYNTEDRAEYTMGGLGTYDEMCLNFIWYVITRTRFLEI